MLASMIVSTLIGAPVAIRVAATDDWLIANLVADAVERTIDTNIPRGALRLPNDERCKQSDRCFEQTRIDFNVDDVLFIRVFSGVTKHLVIIEGFSLELVGPKKVTISLSIDGSGWAEELASVIAELLPVETERIRPPTPALQPIEEPASIWGPSLIMASAVVVAAAAILGEQARGTRMKILDGTESPGEFEGLNGKRRAYAISSLVLYGLGGLFAGGGLVFILFEW